MGCGCGTKLWHIPKDDDMHHNKTIKILVVKCISLAGLPLFLHCRASAADLVNLLQKNRQTIIIYSTSIYWNKSDSVTWINQKVQSYKTIFFTFIILVIRLWSFSFDINKIKNGFLFTIFQTVFWLCHLVPYFSICLVLQQILLEDFDWSKWSRRPNPSMTIIKMFKRGIFSLSS